MSSETNEQGTIMKLIPSNCSDLFQIGHVLNGFYLVLIEEPGTKNSSDQKTLMTKTIFCDFSRSPAVGDGDDDGQYFNSIIASADPFYNSENSNQLTTTAIVKEIDQRIQHLESAVVYCFKLNHNLILFC